ncbi:hypothetical protein BGW36DRAFT_382544 [Talaromyces proteolyticus]|uniref:Uncharacterized protein n=1 Tax=Talaromyces proteolyticus TaxID=1131652 RepID=A0AAD4KN33_9EURO|nr:uncharacterized protein BGW36DRAFT_382544 [Talaromyces proteolyticus]KAH8695362.1 hypothetical protein BGW36DRAFT_382544 [Talaromyces proteolyticus]
MRICLRPSLPPQLRCSSFVYHRNGLIYPPRTWPVEGPPATLCRPTWCRRLATFVQNRKTAPNGLPSRAKELNEGDVYFDSRFSAFFPKARNDASAWVRHLERYLPPGTRADHSKDVETFPSPASTPNTTKLNSVVREGKEIAAILHHARLLEDLDLLAYLGFTLQRWTAVYVLITKMLDATISLQENALSMKSLPSNLNWHAGDIKQITSDRFNLSENKALSMTTGFEQLPVSVSMESLTSEPEADITGSYIMGEIWQSLGFVVLAAADKSSRESELAMSYVYQTIGRLHHSGNISDVVYKYSKSTHDRLLSRPPGMYLLSTHIMNVLTDTAWLAHEAEVSAKAKAAGQNSPFRPFKMGIRHLGHGIWLEFILWSCIESGHIKEGMWILKHMLTTNYGAPWTAVSWNPLLDQPDLLHDTNIDSEDFWPHPNIHRTTEEMENKSGAFHGFGKRTISSEVIAALATHAANSTKSSEMEQVFLRDNIENIALLNSFTNPTTDRWIESSTATHRQIVCVLESQCLDTAAEPKSLELLLKSLPPVPPLWDDSVPTDYPSLSVIDRFDIYNSSSMLTGLLQQTMRTYSTHRQIDDAMRSFAWLQEIIDSSKMERIQGFFQKEKDIVEIQPESSNDLIPMPQASIQIDQSSIPSISKSTLADLIDLITISKAFSFGEWLLFSQDADGPAIPLDSYGDQSLAPSLLRFASATRNQQLGDIVIQRIVAPISRNTFNALLNFRISFHQWDEADAILNLLCQYRLKTWGESTLATLAAVILRLEQSVRGTPQEDAKQSLGRAQALLGRILNGVYNPAKFSHSHLKGHYNRAIFRWYLILSSVDGSLVQVCHKTKLRYTNESGRDSLPYVPSVAFHILLDAVVETRGIRAGMELWKRWCIDIEPSEAALLTEDRAFRLEKSADPRTEHLNPSFDWEWFHEKQHKAVIPNLATVRIISRAAVQQYKELTQASSLVLREDVYDVLDFCVERYRRFGLDKDQIELETSSHVRRQRKSEAKKRRRLGGPLITKYYDKGADDETDEVGYT